MATIKELAVLVAEPLGRPLDKTFLAQIQARVKYWRSRLMKNSLDKNPQERKYFKQSITLPMEEVDAATCNLPLHCKVWRTKNQVPAPLQANSILFDYVGSVDHGNPYKLVARWELPYLLTNKYMPLVTTFYHFEDERILTNAPVPWITIEGIFDDPEVAMRAQCGSDDCDITEMEYPISGNIAQLIVQSILQIDFAQPKNEETKEVEV